ncbi:hypothetical protein [Nocardia sp. NPDC056000]|uniref:hypothetical protein n=1 Tax=Nocardia sp. NPDC056000 TaxID=3345674 RepID=UPI0035DFA6C5
MNRSMMAMEGVLDDLLEVGACRSPSQKINPPTTAAATAPMNLPGSSQARPVAAHGVDPSDADRDVGGAELGSDGAEEFDKPALLDIAQSSDARVGGKVQQGNWWLRHADRPVLRDLPSVVRQPGHRGRRLRIPALDHPVDTTEPAAQIDLTRIALTVGAGVGGVVALVIAYRRLCSQPCPHRSRFAGHLSRLMNGLPNTSPAETQDYQIDAHRVCQPSFSERQALENVLRAALETVSPDLLGGRG